MENKKRFRISKEDKAIIELKATGHQDSEAACILGISQATFRYRYSRILLKLGALNAPHLVYLAFKMGVLKNENTKCPDRRRQTLPSGKQ